MTAYNVVRFQVKPAQDAEFIALQKSSLKTPIGMRKAAMIKTASAASA